MAKIHPPNEKVVQVKIWKFDVLMDRLAASHTHVCSYIFLVISGVGSTPNVIPAEKSLHGPPKVKGPPLEIIRAKYSSSISHLCQKITNHQKSLGLSFVSKCLSVGFVRRREKHGNTCGQTFKGGGWRRVMLFLTHVREQFQPFSKPFFLLLAAKMSFPHSSRG